MSLSFTAHVIPGCMAVACHRQRFRSGRLAAATGPSTTSPSPGAPTPERTTVRGTTAALFDHDCCCSGCPRSSGSWFWWRPSLRSSLLDAGREHDDAPAFSSNLHLSVDEWLPLSTSPRYHCEAGIGGGGTDPRRPTPFYRGQGVPSPRNDASNPSIDRSNRNLPFIPDHPFVALRTVRAPGVDNVNSGPT